MAQNINFDEVERSSNMLSSAIGHLETTKDLIDDCILKFDYSILADLPVYEMNRLAKDYIDCVRFIQNRLDNIVKENTEAVYASPDILSGKTDINSWR